MRRLIQRTAPWAAALALVAACTTAGNGNDDATPPARSPAASTNASTPPDTGADGNRDLLVRDVSVVRPVVVARQQLKASFAIKVVLAKETVGCTTGGARYSVNGAGTQTPFYCTEGYVVLPESVKELWQTWPAIGIWYFAAKSGVISDPVYAASIPRAACAAAFVATRKLGYKFEVDGRKLLEFVGIQRDATEAAFVNAGLILASEGKTIDDCKTTGA